MPFTDLLTETRAEHSIPIEVMPAGILERGDTLSATEQAWVRASGFNGAPGTMVMLPDAGGQPARILIGADDAMPQANDPWWLAGAAEGLPAGDYHLATVLPEDVRSAGSIGWCLAQYRFDLYKSKDGMRKGPRRLHVTAGERTAALNRAEAVALTRDLVNTPTEHMGPAQLQSAVETLAADHDADVQVIAGDNLLDSGFPLIHAVGRAAAADRTPRLIELTWGRADAPKLALVGKGVCFDTGGLNLKPGRSMALMKKDMGGAAHALGLASLIMAEKLDIRLHLLIPAVENAVSGNAFRPGDILASRKGLSVEIGNTDAEGRLILADALTFACEDTPDLLIDFATLTGAARVALGPDLPATFTDDESLWHGLEAAAQGTGDPLWRLPMWAPYESDFASDVADMNNISEGGFAGAIIAALFLKAFVTPTVPWTHLDVFAWRPAAKPGRPKGGAAQGALAAFETVKTRLLSDD